MLSEREFIEALSIWGHDTQSPLFEEEVLVKHWWQSTCTILNVAHKNHGWLSDACVSAVQDVLANCGNATGVPACLQMLEIDVGEREWFEQQLLAVMRGLCSGLMVGHQLSIWPIHEQLPDAVAPLLRQCFASYHEAWNLVTPQVMTIRHDVISEVQDRAGVAIDKFGLTSNLNEEPWWTESNWLLMHRLLSFLLGVEELDRLGPSNQLPMVLVKNEAGGFVGTTARLETSAHVEGWPSGYLDPVSLGITLLDHEMLKSLRLATRLVRPTLIKRFSNRDVSLRVAPQAGSSGLGLLRGASAGGLATVAACATASGKRLNRGYSASFAVRATSRLEDPNSEVMNADVFFLPVDDLSIHAKLTGDHTSRAGITHILLDVNQEHHGESLFPEFWSPFGESSVSSLESDVTLIPVDSRSMGLGEIIDTMASDERIEKVVQRLADQAIHDWQTMLTGEALLGSENHKLDIHIEPRLSVELGQNAIKSADNPFEHKKTFQDLPRGVQSLIDQYISEQWNWILITEASNRAP